MQQLLENILDALCKATSARHLRDVAEQGERQRAVLNQRD